MGKIKDKTGERKVMNCGLEAEIINYVNKNNITIKFENGKIIKGITYEKFKNGNVEPKKSKNVNNKPKSNKDKPNKIKDKNGKIKKSYGVWVGMMRRCYDQKDEHYNNYGGRGVTVCEEWHNYENFEKWYNRHYYEVEGEIMHLDKDILNKNSKVYSPDTCIFVPHRINQLFRSKRGEDKSLPKGVRKSGNRFYSHCCVDGKDTSLGTYDTVEEAFKAYKKAKESEIQRVAEEYKDRIPYKLYKAMMKYRLMIRDE